MGDRVEDTCPQGGGLPGAGYCGPPCLLLLPKTRLANGEDHQRHRARLPRSAQTHPPNELFPEQRELREDHLRRIHPPEPALEQARPRPIYTTILTLPPRLACCPPPGPAVYSCRVIAHG